MPNNTIPAPTKHHIENATFAISQCIERCGLEDNSSTIQLLNEMVAVQAQLQAEIDWLRGMVHNPSELTWKVGERRDVTDPDLVLNPGKPAYIVRTL